MIMAISKRLKNNKGFTLVELIVVIAVLGILAAIAVPRLSGVKEDAAWKADIATAANLGKAGEMYTQMNDIKGEKNNPRDITTELKENGYINKEDLKSQYFNQEDALIIEVDENGVVSVKYDLNDYKNVNLYPEPSTDRPEKKSID